MYEYKSISSSDVGYKKALCSQSNLLPCCFCYASEICVSKNRFLVTNIFFWLININTLDVLFKYLRF